MPINPIYIKTKRLILKGFTPLDMEFIFENYPIDEIKKELGHRTEEEYRNEEKKHKNGYSTYNRSFLLFLLIHIESDSIIGRCGLHNWNVEHKRAEIGYNMNDEMFKQQGLMSEAVNSIIQYGFNDLKLNRIEALVGSQNKPSLKILEKYGFIKEGLLRQHHFTSDKFEDSIVFSLLNSEYMNNIHNNRTNL